MRLDIKGDRLFRDGTAVTYIESPHRGGRIRPTAIVVHDTAGPSASSAISHFRNPKSRNKASAHIVIDRDGAITQMVPFDHRANHAGISAWKGRRGCNGFTIGIELANPGLMTKRGSRVVGWWGGTFAAEDCRYEQTKAHGRGWWLPYTHEQMDALCRAIGALKRAYPTILEVIGHHDVSPGRKVDPTPLMEWTLLRHALKNAAPEAPTPTITHEHIHAVQHRLNALGYAPGKADGIAGPMTERAVMSFQRENDLEVSGALNAKTITAIQGDAAKAFPTGAREAADPAEVDAASRTAQTASVGRRDAITKASLGFAALIASTFEGISSTIDKLAASPSGVVMLAAGAILAAAGLIDYARYGRIRWLRIADHQSGKNAGGAA